MSTASSRRRTSATVSGAATPSSQRTATAVPLLRPTVVWYSFSAGVHRRRRTSAVFTRSVSTKASLPPLTVFSTVGGPTARVLVPRTSKQTAAPRASKTTAQHPPSRRPISLSMSSHRSAV